MISRLIPIWLQRGLFERAVGIHQISRLYSAHAHYTNYDMEKVYLRHTGGEELHINFRYTNVELRVDRDFNFCRNMNEKVDDALTRIRNNIEKELTKRAKKRTKKKTTPTEVQEMPSSINEISVEFWREGSETKITDITFAEMLADNGANGLQLRVLDSNLEMVFNQPWVVNMLLPTTMLAGFAVYPSRIEMQFAERQYSKASWFRAKMPSSGDIKNGSQWQHCGDGCIYQTSNEDVGQYLKLVLSPGNAEGQLGPAVEYISKQEVQAGPGPCPFETRHCFTQQRLQGDQFRVVSYNLLADLYADSDYTRTHLFPYCPSYALKVDYRKQLYMKELLGYNADVLCLQEVDMKIFDFDLKPIFELPEYGYTGWIAQKGNCGEGVATFYREERYELLDSFELNIGEQIRLLPEFDKLWRLISGNEKLVERICDRSTTLQLSVLKCKEVEDRFLLVANTHLYFHPDADHIRLLQMGFSMLYVEHVYRKTAEKLQLNSLEVQEKLGIVFCGDFNSVPECGIYKLMTEGFVDENFVDWRSNMEQAVEGVKLSQPFCMQSACGTPPYTNFTHAFAACLDYIFYKSDALQVEQVVPLPTDDELKAHIAIPSVVFPSDHVALVADLKFRRNSKNV